jgi:hypothetical protein
MLLFLLMILQYKKLLVFIRELIQINIALKKHKSLSMLKPQNKLGLKLK